MLTRKQYLNGECTHREYYAQFVDERTKHHVRFGIGMKTLRASTCEHLNDITLKRWDRLVPCAPGSGKFKEAGDSYTLSGGVCMLKEAAKQLLEEETSP